MNNAFRTARVSCLIFATTVILTACGGPPPETSTHSNNHYPVTVENCGAEVTFQAEPQRLVMLKPASATALQAIGVLDRTVARAGAFDEEYFDQSTQSVIDEIPNLTSDLDASGHLLISADIVIDQQPDLLLGEVENLPRQQLEQLNIPLVEEPALCQTSSSEVPTWDSVYEQLFIYGDIFNREHEAQKAVTGLEERVANAAARVSATEDRTAAVLYPTVGGGTTYAYGRGSMSHPQLEAAGFTNVFGDMSERVFEISVEELIGRDPDVLILLHSGSDPVAVEQAITDMPGADQITAVRDGQILTQLIHFTEPATPLSVDGLERIIERFSND